MEQQRVVKNKVVYLTYRILDGTGSLYEESETPIGYIHGVGGELFEELADALEGRAAGDRVEVTLAAEDGFGPHKPEYTFTEDITNLPEEFRHVGAEVEFENERGDRLTFRVTRIQDGKLTLDANHPLAGQDVTFVVDVKNVRDASPDEIASGEPSH